MTDLTSRAGGQVFVLDGKRSGKGGGDGWLHGKAALQLGCNVCGCRVLPIKGKCILGLARLKFHRYQGRK